MITGVRTLTGASLIVALALFVLPTHATQTLQSPNYRFDESSIGTGGLMQGSSASYRVESATGDLSVGTAASSNFQVEAGSRTSADPTLTFKVDSAEADFGEFSAASTATSTASFSVINYTSYGYVVQLVGDPPKYGNNEIAPMSATAASQPGVEQFGVNMVANTSPESFGSNPDNGTSPDDFGFGQITPNYSTPNQFRYVSGESIASAPKSSGKTTYTLSYIVNVTPLTPSGQYTGDQTLVVTGTY